MSVSFNLVHGSDGPESAATELGLFFPGADELVSWTPSGERWVYDVEGEKT
jgi:nucleoside-diphosphate kinase